MYKKTHNTSYSLRISFQGSEDIEEEISSIPLNVPYIIVMEASEATTYDVIVKRSSLFQSTDLCTALIDILSSYFVFDIAYLPELYPLLLFFQHYVFELKDNQKVPVSVATTVGTMRSLD